MEKVIINEKEYELVSNYRDAYNQEVVSELLTDYFDEFDYVVGDIAYNKLRLKGFYESSNSKCSKINDIKNLDDYIKNNCAYGCRWFKLKKIK